MELRLASAFGTQFVRNLSTSSCVCGKRNFKKFPLYNKRGTRDFKAKQAKNPHPEIPIHRKHYSVPIFLFNFFGILISCLVIDYGVRPIGVSNRGLFEPIESMIPELVVPDLTDFKVFSYPITLKCSFHAC